MRQPTFFAHACPRFDHHVYCSGRGSTRAEHVDAAELVEHAREPCALLGQEPRVLLVGAPVPEVDRLVRDVPVAAQHDLAPARAQRLEVRQEDVQEPELDACRCSPLEPDGRYIDTTVSSLEVRLEIAPLVVELGVAEPVLDAMRQLAT